MVVSYPLTAPAPAPPAALGSPAGSATPRGPPFGSYRRKHLPVRLLPPLLLSPPPLGAGELLLAAPPRRRRGKTARTKRINVGLV